MITQQTGLQPCQVRLAGTRRGNQTDPDSAWAFDGNGPSEWASLEEGLAFVLSQLDSSKATFSEYRKSYDLIWWCGHFQSTFDGGPVLSAGMLERLAAFGVELFIDNYFSEAPTGT
jgi:hypothetical protein